MELRPLSSPPTVQAVPSERDSAAGIRSGTASMPPASSAIVAGPGKQGSQQLDQAVEHINKTLAQSRQGVEFSVDKDTDLNVVKVIDRETKAVLRQMPNEEALAIARQIDRTQGLLIKQKA